MAELLFGTGPQLWPAIPVPGFAYFQTLPGNRMFAGAPPTAIGSQASPFSGSVMPGGPMVASASPPDATQGGTWAAVPGTPHGAGVPVLGVSDYTTGVTPQTLLATVAMRRGQPMGPTSDQEFEDFIYDALDLLPGANDVEVRYEGGRATVTGSVPHKRVKRDVGEILWAISSVNDVQNNITIATRRRSRSTNSRDTETSAVTGGSRKQA